MCCEEYRETILEVATDLASRRRIAEAFAHANNCDACRSSLLEMDQVADLLRGDREPSASAAEPSGGWDAFEQRMLRATDRQLGPLRILSPVWSGVRWRATAFGVAAALLAAFGAFWFGQQSALAPRAVSIHQIAVRSTPRFALEPSEVVHDAREFATVSKAFEGRTGWMLASDSDAARSNDDLDFSNDTINSDRTGSDQTVDVLRLVMLHGGEVVSSVDLVILPGRSADLTVKLSPGKSVHYRAAISSGNDSPLNLLAEIKTAHIDRPLAVLSTTLDLQQSGQVSAGELQTTTGRYELRSAFSRTTLPAS